MAFRGKTVFQILVFVAENNKKMNKLQVLLTILLIGSALSVKQKDAQPAQAAAIPVAPAAVETAPAAPENSASASVQTIVEPPVTTVTETPAPEVSTNSPAPTAETQTPQAKAKILAQTSESDDESDGDEHPTVGAEVTSHGPTRKHNKPSPADDDDDLQHLVAKPLTKPHTVVKNFYSSHSDVTKLVNGKGTRTIKDNVNGKKSKKVIKIGQNKPINIGRHNHIEEFD